MKFYSPTGRVVPPPELQRLPPHTEVGREILTAVQEGAQATRPPLIVNVDYAELELRVLAQVLEDHDHG